MTRVEPIDVIIYRDPDVLTTGKEGAVGKAEGELRQRVAASPKKKASVTAHSQGNGRTRH